MSEYLRGLKTVRKLIQARPTQTTVSIGARTQALIDAEEGRLAARQACFRFPVHIDAVNGSDQGALVIGDLRVIGRGVELGSSSTVTSCGV